jgi:hypothetical protein
MKLLLMIVNEVNVEVVARRNGVRVGASGVVLTARNWAWDEL